MTYDLGDFEGGPSGGNVLRARGDAINSLSPTAVATFLTCPEKYRQSYLLGNWGPTYPAMVLGSAYHHALRMNDEQKQWSGTDVGLAELATFYEDGWNQAASSNGIEWGKADADEVYDLGWRMALSYFQSVSCDVFPVGVEERVWWRVDGVPVPIVGYLDVRHEHDGQRRIIDRKTIDKTGRMQSPKPSWRVQALIYMTAFASFDFEWHVHGKDAPGRVLTPTGTPSLLLRNTRARRETAETLVRMAWTQMEELSGRYGHGQPWPGAIVQGDTCGRCSYRRRCYWWR